jgi:hypothetical protein
LGLLPCTTCFVSSWWIRETGYLKSTGASSSMAIRWRRQPVSSALPPRPARRRLSLLLSCTPSHSFSLFTWTRPRRIKIQLHYKKGDGEGELYAYSDAAFADCRDTRRFTGGYLIFKGPNLVGWRSHLQSSVSTSTTHAEYVELS